MKKILFVDDEENILEGLQRTLRPLRNEWDMVFLNSGAEALEALKKESFDVILSDLWMAEMNGPLLLAEAKKISPETVRIILSGTIDEDYVMKSVSVAQQYLIKPCDIDTLQNTVNRACALHSFLANDELKKLIGQMKSLPSLPSLYREIVEELQLPDSSLQKIGKIFEKDIAMTARILQLVNSAFFGVRRKISSPAKAVGLLGVETVQSLVLSLEIFSQFHHDKPGASYLDELWKHSMTVGMFTQTIARLEEKDLKKHKLYMTAGLLHDTGKLVLCYNFPDKYSEIVSSAQGSAHFLELEYSAFGASHMEIGAYLLGIWGLLDPIVEAAGFHHNPQQCITRAFSPLAAVHVADAFVHQIADEADELIDDRFIEDLGVSNRIAAWRDACMAAISARTV
jgi:HD-like signal output (HDOD) protein